MVIVLVVAGVLSLSSAARAQAPEPSPTPAPTHDAAPPADGHDAAAPAGDATADATHDAPGAVAEAAHEPAGHGEAEAHGEDHGESIWVTLARVANFAILAGGLFYFLRGPIAAHLAARGTQIRGDLHAAAQMKADASARLAEIEQRLAGLPAELALVKQRGAEEVAAEEARILRQAEVERDRLVAQARREIDQHVRTARQTLRAEAAALAVGVAEQRLRQTLTEAEQQRLADGFASRIGAAR